MWKPASVNFFKSAAPTPWLCVCGQYQGRYTDNECGACGDCGACDYEHNEEIMSVFPPCL